MMNIPPVIPSAPLLDDNVELHSNIPLVILDTNIVLDCFVFQDSLAENLVQYIMTSKVHWIATHPMYDEYMRVLTYANVAKRVRKLSASQQEALPLLFERYAKMVAEPDLSSQQSAVCRDPDDQIFIDLAASYSAILLSKDDEVLRLNKRKGLTIMNLKTLAKNQLF